MTRPPEPTNRPQNIEWYPACAPTSYTVKPGLMNRANASCIYGSYVPKMNCCEMSSSISHLSVPAAVSIVITDPPQLMSLAHAGLSPLNRYFTVLGTNDVSLASRWGNIIFLIKQLRPWSACSLGRLETCPPGSGLLDRKLWTIEKPFPASNIDQV